MKHVIYGSVMTTLLLMGVSGLASAGPITYDLASYADYQNGYTLSGTITTDGTIGVISSTDVLAWNITMTNGTFTAEATSTASDALLIMQGPVTATPTQILLPPDGPFPAVENIIDMQDGPLSAEPTGLLWSRTNNTPGNADYYLGRVASSPQSLWDNQVSSPPGLSLGGPTWVIANAVPEPSTLTLVGIATLCMAGVRRRALSGPKRGGRSRV